ncbi:hypothetical protein JKF63_00615 [Porcisia hertigi]|uniref:ABC transporter domain-containing protein n=1 Tax=Porcisia hertigi TaxID=2761500 RepID=A0A836I8K6_9TRYP|nr:hypothetical protein JKF63_00615 [Porcisia hertigi]
MSDSWRRYRTQLYGFLVKTFLQRWRTPVSTVLEVFLPCLFTILLSITFWLSDESSTPAMIYDGRTGVLDVSAILSFSLCKPPGSSLGLTRIPCSPGEDPHSLKCLSLIGNGREVCMTPKAYESVSGILYAMYYGTESFRLNTMDGHLILSALVTEESRRDNPTFFGRGGKASLAHYGLLLVSSDSRDVAQEFMTFCRTKSTMCGEVLYKEPFSSLDDAQNYAAANENTVWAIVHIPEASLTSSGVTEFTISMNFSATASTSNGSPRSLFTRGPATRGHMHGSTLYWASGFMTLQTFVQEFYLGQLMANNPLDGRAIYATDPETGRRGISEYLSQYGSVIVPMPTPQTYKNSFLEQWAYYMPLLAVMAVLYPASRLVLLIVDEKHNGIREAMLIMGLHPSCMFFGWYSSAFIMDVVASILAAIVLRFGFLYRVNYGLLLLLYFSFMQQNTALCFFISSLSRNPRVASWFIAFVLFVCAIPSFSFPDGMRDVQKICCCLVPCVGYSEAFKMMLNYVSFGMHFGWKEANTGYFNFATVIGMMWASFGTLMLIAYYLDRVSFGAVGRSAHPLFFLMPLVRLFRKRKAPMIKMSDMGRPIRPGSMVKGHNSDDAEVSSGSSILNPLKSGEKDSLQVNAQLIEHYHDVVNPLEPENAVVFHRLRKVYVSGGILGFFYTYFTGLFRKGDRVAALDGVTFTMRSGEVSVLLGPNGAGKSTIMGLATGMVRPTSGDVYVRGYNGATHMDECRQNIGYCPQRDIVWPLLTVEEHITFYARMKGSDSVDVQKKVEYALDLVDLHEKRKCKASNLSAGQRRRLCVAIAMVGDSSVLLLDEPTAGMDIKNRKKVYDALNRSRANRSVLISTHLLDEADRIADRVFILDKGVLCAEGSTLFLKSQMEVGYVVTCLLKGSMPVEEEDTAAEELMSFVRAESSAAQRIASNSNEECALLGVQRRGREVCFRFPITLLGSVGVALISTIQRNSERLHLQNISLDLTTLEDVFVSLTHTMPLMSNITDGELIGGREDGGDLLLDPKTHSTITDLYEKKFCFLVFFSHFRALFLKRWHYAQRDVRLLIYQVVLPIMFLLLSLLINLVRDPSQPALRLDMTMYDDYASNPSQVLTGYSAFGRPGRGGGPPPRQAATNAYALDEKLPDGAWGPHYLTDFRKLKNGPPNASYELSHLLSAELGSHSSPRYIAVSPMNLVFGPGGPRGTPIVLHNTSNPHAAPQGVDALYHLAGHQLFGSKVPQPTVVNSPMKLGKFETGLVSVKKQVMIGIFIILPFIFIPSNTIAYIVEEKESGSRHMQWLSGAGVAAYWLSSFVFDCLSYIATQILAFIVLALFGRTEYVSKDMVGPAMALFFFFGVSSIPFSYFLSFFFRSGFAAQSVVFCINFTCGFLWVIAESMIAPHALRFVKVTASILRIFPSTCFGEGMFVLSGTQMANMMFPNREKTSLFAPTYFRADGSPSGGIGTGLIYMSVVGVSCSLVLLVLEYLRLHRLSFIFTRCCVRRNPEDEEEHLRLVNADPSVKQEEDHVCSVKTGPDYTGIAVQHLHKRYFGSQHAAVQDISFGVREGEVMGMLGLNGAGKSTVMSVLAGETVATSGQAFVNHYAAQSMMSRFFIGYCPQYDALLSNLSAEEHLWLYARLRGIKEKYIGGEVQLLLKELGLYPFRSQSAASLSGGNKRRLSLAIAMVGHTTGVLLDEPTAGMDPVARAQTCSVVRSLAAGKSVLLSTHILDEVEALADRVAVVVQGNLRCIGTPQELKGTYNTTAAYTLHVLFSTEVHLQGADAKLVEEVRRYVLDTITASTAVDMQKGDRCVVLEVFPYSMQLSVSGDLASICKVASEMQAGKAKEIPPAKYVSVSQPTLEDILLLQ